MKQPDINSPMEVKDALELIRSLESTGVRTKTVRAQDSLNHILADDLIAAQDIPLHDNSAMDGYVFRKADLDAGMRLFPVSFEVRPEDTTQKELPEGEAAQIMTGASIPPSADFVIPVELTEIRSDKVFVTEVPERNAIRKQGEGYRTGDILLPAGTVLRPYETGLIIESGNQSVKVNDPLHIGLQVSGSEIDDSNNTNGPVLKSILSSWPGTEVTEHPVLGDNPEEVAARLHELKKKSDVIVTTGGISAGKHDYFFDILQQAGARCLIRKINQKPGKPFTLFKWDDVYVCNLPGNPVSAVFTAEVYLKELVYRITGLPAPVTFKATALKDMNNPGSKTLFVPGRIILEYGMVGVEAEARMRSHLMQLYRGNQVYVKLDPGTEVAKGESVECRPFSSGLA